jgi:RimJ/RimL family protein N-acetyltransferase
MNTIYIPELQTLRLRLRTFGHADFDAYAAMWKDAEVVRFIGGVPLSREAAWSRFLRQMGAWHYLGFGFFAIEDKATGAFIGEAGFLAVFIAGYISGPSTTKKRALYGAEAVDRIARTMIQGKTAAASQ